MQTAVSAASAAAVVIGATGCTCTARHIFARQATQQPVPEQPEPEPEPEPETGQRSGDERLGDTQLPKRRTTREVQESLSVEERFFTVGEEALARRAVEVEALQRCPDCWHNRNQHCGGNRCICAQLPDLTLSVNVRVLVYMHYLEWMNSGNSGKLLLKCLPKQSAQLFLYGRRQDDERLQALVAADPGRTALLFPSPDAVSLGDFVTAAAQDVVAGATTKQNHRSQMLTLVVLDATYRKAKNMAKHFQRCIDGTGQVRTVALKPEALSVFARAQHGIAARGKLGRLCTVEAVALALKDVGEKQQTVDALVECVRHNNAAIDPGNARSHVARTHKQMGE